MSSSQPNRILLVGSNGQVGSELLPRLASRGELLATTRTQLDLSSEESIRAVVRSFKPTVIINAAAYTAVDRAESEPELAMRVNGIAPGIFAEEARACRAVLVHYSTDYVFDGAKRSPYLESDPTAPLNEYGRSKLRGEKLVAASAEAYFILRTSWVYSAHGSNFLLTMLRLGQEREQLRVVNDQLGAPTSAAAVAEFTVHLLQRLGDHRLGLYKHAKDLAGIYNTTCRGETSWFEFARSIFSEAQKTELGKKLKVAEVLPIRTDEYPTPAVRPKYSVLCGDKMVRNLGMQLPMWQDSLTHVMHQLANE